MAAGLLFKGTSINGSLGLGFAQLLLGDSTNRIRKSFNSPYVYPGQTVDSDVVAYNGLQITDPSVIDPNYASLTFQDSQGTTQFKRAAVHLYFLPPVTATATAPGGGTVTNTQRPNLNVSLSLTVEAWQLPAGQPPYLCGMDVECQVFRTSDAPGASPPAGITPLFQYVARASEATAGARTPAVGIGCGVYLANGSYTVFMRASRDTPAGQQQYWSAWSKATWTQNLTLPTAPTLTLTADPAGQRMQVQHNTPATAGYDSATAIIEVQRQVATGWRAVRGMASTAITAGGGLLSLGYDYECDRELANTYRVRCSMVSTADQIRRYGTWATFTAAGPAFGSTGWNLKAVELPAASLLGAGVQAEPSEEDLRQSQVVQPLDRDLPVVVKGASSGTAGQLEILCGSAAEIAAADALIDYTGLVLLETAFGDVSYVAVTKASWARQGTRAAPRRILQVSYTQVACDLTVEAS